MARGWTSTADVVHDAACRAEGPAEHYPPPRPKTGAQPRELGEQPQGMICARQQGRRVIGDAHGRVRVLRVLSLGTPHRAASGVEWGSVWGSDDKAGLRDGARAGCLRGDTDDGHAPSNTLPAAATSVGATGVGTTSPSSTLSLSSSSSDTSSTRTVSTSPLTMDMLGDGASMMMAKGMAVTAPTTGDPRLGPMAATGDRGGAVTRRGRAMGGQRRRRRRECRGRPERKRRSPAGWGPCPRWTGQGAVDPAMGKPDLAPGWRDAGWRVEAAAGAVGAVRSPRHR